MAHPMPNLPESRMRHCFAVAEKMRELAEQFPTRCHASPQDMYVLGLLHDFGYQFSGARGDHAVIGGTILRDLGFKYWREVYYHSAIQFEYYSPQLILLYYADAVVGPNGENMALQERLDDIAVRYGRQSSQYAETETLVRYFKTVFS